jgi:hypothetical protein
MIDSGLGSTQINKILSTLNIPIVGDSCIKRHEEVVGEALWKQAEQSMNSAVQKEINLTW